MIKVIQFDRNISYEEYTKYNDLLFSKDQILFDMISVDYIPASMIGFLITLKQNKVNFKLLVSSRVENIFKFKNVYNYLMEEDHE